MTKTWFITGASSGLGLDMTTRLLARGDRVLGTARNTAALADLQRKYSDALIVKKLELTDAVAIKTTMDEAFATLGTIDVIVSNAGYGLFGAAEELTDTQIEHQIATNLTGSIHLIRAALPHLRRQGGGRFIQVSSEGGQISYPNFSAYDRVPGRGVAGFHSHRCFPVGSGCL
ncbi:SDR family NAD(P)-dependent oxidoreductase [Agrobacterium bohemicum]|uniref:SDR family NAD(P)-dependent oxidoreductase n=1 Tax=Agrobacterium bohemicum TaxID=2052828 RepID=UPI0009EA8F7A